MKEMGMDLEKSRLRGNVKCLNEDVITLNRELDKVYERLVAINAQLYILEWRLE